jgi:hypothetical protein
MAGAGLVGNFRALGKIQGIIVHWIFPKAWILPVNCFGWRIMRHPGTIARKPPGTLGRRALQPARPETSRPDSISLTHPILRQI